MSKEQITRKALKQLLYMCMYTEKERKTIFNDGSVFLADVEAAMSLHDQIVKAKRKQKELDRRENAES